MKKVYNATLENLLVVYGYMGAKNAEIYEAAVREWEEFFTDTGLIGDDYRALQNTYDQVLFLHNANFRPSAEIFADIWEHTQTLPIFHAAVVLLKKERPVGLYVFNHAEDMVAMINAHPYDQFVMKNGYRYIDVAKACGIKFSFKDYKEPALIPNDWENPHQYDEFDFMSVPCWPNQEIHDAYEHDTSLRILNFLDSVVNPMSPELTEMVKKGQIGVSIQRNRYIFNTPNVEIVVCHHAIIFATGTKSILLIQNDVVPNDENGIPKMGG